MKYTIDPNTGYSDAPIDWTEPCATIEPDGMCLLPTQERCENCNAYTCEKHMVFCEDCRVGWRTPWCEYCAIKTGAFEKQPDGSWLCENCMPEREQNETIGRNSAGVNA